MWCIPIVVWTPLQLWRNPILLDWSNFHMFYNLSIAFRTFAKHMLTSLSVDDMLLLKYMNCYTNFRGLPFTVEMTLSFLKHLNSVLFELMLWSVPLAACSRLCSRDLAWTGEFARRAWSSVYSVSVIIFVGYCLFLAVVGFFFSLCKTIFFNYPYWHLKYVI